MLSIEMLGGLRISAQGKVPKKSRAMLAYLAMQHGAAVDRAKLADLLWPYQGQEQSRHSLRNALLETRKALRSDAAHLLSDFTSVRLVGVTTDFEKFWALAESSELDDIAAAAQLYVGPLLDGLEISSEPWGEWLDFARRRAQEIATSVFARLSNLASAAGDHSTAIAAARRLVTDDPYSDVACRLTMTALAAAGRKVDALRHYADHKMLLHRELCTMPDRATVQLTEEIRRASPPVLPADRLLALQADLRRIAGEFRAVLERGEKFKRGQIADAIGIMLAAARNLPRALTTPAEDVDAKSAASKTLRHSATERVAA